MTMAKRKSLAFLIVTALTFIGVMVALKTEDPTILIPALGFWAFMVLGQSLWELWKLVKRTERQ